VFAARAGAKHVYAIEASGFANKARQNIKNNGLEDVITYVESEPAMQTCLITISVLSVSFRARSKRFSCRSST
jgi:hypothetical protein